MCAKNFLHYFSRFLSTKEHKHSFIKRLHAGKKNMYVKPCKKTFAKKT